MEQPRELEPIAIIGMSCRLPGGASSPEQLWDNLANGASAWSTAPKERFNLETFHDPANTHATTVSFSTETRWRHKEMPSIFF